MTQLYREKCHSISTTILQDVSKQQYGMFNSINCLFLLLTAFYLIQIYAISPTSGESASTLCAVTKKLMASGICLTAPGFNLTSLITSFLRVSEVFNLPQNKQCYSVFSINGEQQLPLLIHFPTKFQTGNSIILKHYLPLLHFTQLRCWQSKNPLHSV